MKRACAENWEHLVSLAEGHENAAARAHLESCADCTRAFAELRAMMRAASVSFFSPPSSLVEAAIGLMPVRARVGLVRSTLGLAGARSDAEDFQLVVSVGEVENRLMYVREGSGWEVVGRVPGSDWRVSRAGAEVELEEDGRFSFRAADLASTGFELVGPVETFEVPSAEELLLDAG